MSIYDITYKDFVIDYLPVDKRKPVNIAYLTALLTPVETVHVDTFGPYRDDVIERSKQNGQRILFESILNNKFGVTSAPLIYIDNSGDNITPNIFFNENEGLPPVIMFNESEGQPPLYMRNESEASVNREFIIFVPIAVFTAVGVEAIKAEADRLKPYSTNYKIITY